MVTASPTARGPWLPLAVAGAAALALCTSIGWLLFDQRATLTKALVGLEHFRQARLDLANGMLHHSLAGGPDVPYDRAQGAALLIQGVEEVQESDVIGTGPGQADSRELLASFRASADRFLAELGQSSAGPRDPAAEARLRLAFHELDRAASRFDVRRRAGLRELVDRLDRNLAITGSAAAALLVASAIASLLVVRSRVRSVAALRASEDRLSTVLDNLAEGVVIADGAGRYLQWNRAAADLLHFADRRLPSGSRDVLDRLEVFDTDGAALPPAQWPVARVSRGETLRQLEVVVRHRSDGSRRTLMANGALGIGDTGDRFVCVSFSDVTERRRAESELRAGKDRLDRLTRTTPGVVCSFRLDAEGRSSFPYVSPQVQELYGVTPEELQRDGGAVFAGMHADDRARVWESIERSRRDMVPWCDEFRFQHPVRGEIWVEGHSMPVDDGDGAVVWHGVLTEITERKRVEAVIRAQDSLLREMGRLAKVGGWEFDPSTQKLSSTPEVASIFDLDADSVANHYLDLQFFDGESRPRIEAALAAAVGDGTPFDFELPFVSAHGVRKWGRMIGQPLLVDGRVQRVRGAFMDVTERKEAEALARLQHASTRILAESGTIAEMAPRILAGICDSRGFAGGELLLVERARGRLRCIAAHVAPGFQRSDFVASARDQDLGRGVDLPGQVWAEGAAVVIADLASHDGFLRRDAALAAGVRSVMAVPICSPTSLVGVLQLFHSEPWKACPNLESTLAAIAAKVGNFVDRLGLEEQFRQTQKMEALGTLAGGIAHDFNNILTAILGNTELLRLEFTDRPALRESVDAVIAASHRATDLVRRILAFSRMQDPERRAVSLQDLVGETGRLLRASIPSTIEFGFDLDTGAPAVMADPSQVHQVVLNLCTNAAHAMAGHPGRLEFVLERCDVDDDLVAAHLGLRRGLHARLSIRDTGHGMDAATLARVFEPFFTTKPPGQGTGLGLSVVHGIMQAHGGAVAVFSEPGEGSRFDLYFPATDAGSGAEAAAPVALPLPRGRGESILLVDDEEAISRLGKRMLEGLGYHVDAVSSSQRGLQAFADAPDTYALVITDLTMPGMTGIELAERIHAVRREVPVILTTGFSATVTPERARESGVRMVLQKPIALERLTAAVHAVLQNEQ